MTRINGISYQVKEIAPTKKSEVDQKPQDYKSSQRKHAVDALRLDLQHAMISARKMGYKMGSPDMNYEHIIHPIPPYYNPDSRILILGSFPSIKTRESGFFYGHPQNRFWKLISAIFGEETVPVSIDEKKSVLLRNRIALWDSIYSCDIVGSSDSSIKNVVPNDIGTILQEADIKSIYTNGRKSHEIYRKYCLPLTGREDVCLPSTSPANAAWSLNKLIESWGRIS